MAAGVQAPTIYRLFGDKQGLVDAVAEHGFTAYLQRKRTDGPSADPVENLRLGWDLHVDFGLANPAIFALMSGAGATPLSPAAGAGIEALRERVLRVARAGSLRVGAERAVDLIHAAGTGTVLVLLGKPEAERADVAAAAREAIMATVLARPEDRRAGATPAVMASGLRSGLAEISVLTPGERLLLDELLRRIANA